MDLLFVCCDMGETNALKPVMQELHRRAVDFKVLAMGAAIPTLWKEDCAVQDSIKKYVIELGEPVNTAQNRAKPLENVSKAIKGLDPKVVISGSASKAQAQILEALPAKRKFVYIDNFNYDTTNPSFETVKEVARQGKKLICVTDIVKEQLIEALKDQFSEKSIKKLGRPSLEEWVERVHGTDKARTLAIAGGLDDSKKVVTFIGGYGPRYDDNMKTAYEQAKNALHEAGYQTYEQPHPNVRPSAIKTESAIGIADYVICYDSTVGFESLFAGKTVFYLQPEGAPVYDNIALQKGLATRVHNPQELLEAIRNDEQPKECVLVPYLEDYAKEVYEALGVPQNSTKTIADYLTKKIRRQDSLLTTLFKSIGLGCCVGK